MNAVPVSTSMTVEEFLARPAPATGHEELVEGELVVSFPTLAHQRVVVRLIQRIGTWIEAGADRGEVTIEIDTAAGRRSVLGPDVQWYAPGRELADPTTRPQPLGDLVAEVRSPSTWAIDVGPKKALYEREGVSELWLVDPTSRTVLVYRRQTPSSPGFDVAFDLADGDDLTSPLLDGFGLPLGDILGQRA